MRETFQIYAHAEHDEECEWYAEDDIDRHGSTVPLDKLTEFYNSNPLYEVQFDVEYDHDTKTFEVVAARTGGWELTR